MVTWYGKIKFKNKLIYISNIIRNLKIHFSVSRSSRGLGHRPFTAATGVRIPYGMPQKFNYLNGFVYNPKKTSLKLLICNLKFLDKKIK